MGDEANCICEWHEESAKVKVLPEPPARRFGWLTAWGGEMPSTNPMFTRRNLRQASST